MDEFNKGQSQPGFIGTGEGEVPLANPLPTNTNIRTMSSDVQSIQSNDSTPRGYVPKVDGSIFTPPQIPVSAATPFSMPPQAPKPSIETPLPKMPLPKKSGKGLLWTLITIVIIVGLGALGYFVVYPFVSSYLNTAEQTVEVVTPPIEEPVVTPPVTEPVVTPPVVTPPAVLVPVYDVLNHTTLLKTPITTTEEKILLTPVATPITPDVFKKLFTFTTVQTPVTKEVVLKGSDGKIAALPPVLAQLLGDVFTPAIVDILEPDGTILLYTNAKGSWLSFVVKTKAGMSFPENFKTTLEASPALKNIFLTDPGVAGAWKDGKFSGRYSTYSADSAGINYTILGTNTFLLSTNYSAYLDAAAKLGF